MLRRDGTLGWPLRAVLFVVVAGGLYAATSDPFTTVFFLSYVIVGSLLVIRLPKNPVSWLLVGIAFGFIGTTSRQALDYAALKAGTAAPDQEIWAAVNSWSATAGFLMFAALAATFPSGRLPAGHWRLPLAGALALGSAVLLAWIFAPNLHVSTDGVHEILVPNPAGLIPAFPGIDDVLSGSFVVILAVFAMSIVSLLERYRQSTETTRLQIRWLMAAIAFVLVGASFGLILGTAFPGLGVSVWIPAIVAYPTVPIAVGVAVLRYRLYEIDRIVNRALVYGGVTAILAGVFAGVTALSQRIFVALTGQKSDAAIVLTTLAVATLYAPIRKPVEALVDRYFKYDQRLFGAYRDELRKALDVLAPIRAAQRLAHEARAETGARGVAVTGSDGSVLASSGDWPAEPSIAVPVRAGGAPLAAVLLGPRPDGRPHRSQAIAALGEVAAMAGLAATAIPADGDGQPVGQAER